MTRDKLIRALRARGKSDQLAQMAADMLESQPAGFIITERVQSDIGKDLANALDAGAIVSARNPKPLAKKTLAKKAVKR